MQLRNNLYTVIQKEVDGLKGRFTLVLNPSCFIYQAHFPGEPITPGVCTVQMGQELLENLLEETLQKKVELEIRKVKNVKFLSVITPTETAVIAYQMKQVEMSEDGSEVKAQIVVTSSDEVKVKISLVLSMKCQTWN